MNGNSIVSVLYQARIIINHWTGLSWIGLLWSISMRVLKEHVPSRLCILADWWIWGWSGICQHFLSQCIVENIRQLKLPQHHGNGMSGWNSLNIFIKVFIKSEGAVSSVVWLWPAISLATTLELNPSSQSLQWVWCAAGSLTPRYLTFVALNPSLSNTYTDRVVWLVTINFSQVSATDKGECRLGGNEVYF